MDRRFRADRASDRAVNFACSDHGLIGQFVEVEIVEALPNSLRGLLPGG